MLNLCCGYLGGARKIVNFAKTLQKVKFTGPIITNYKGVDAKFFDVGNLLLPTGFRNNKINISYRFKKLLTLLIVEKTALLLARPVELIGR